MIKKIIIFLLLIILLIVAVFAIYLASSLNFEGLFKPTITVTPGITNKVIPTNTNNVTFTPTVITSTTPSNLSEAVCGQSCINTNCSSGNTCVSINGNKKCVLLSCVTLQNGTYAPNNTCAQDLCTGLNQITITKTGTMSCSNTQNSRKLTVKIKITNPVSNSNDRTNISVLDQFNINLKNTYITNSSISDGGKLENGKITWTGISLSKSGGSKELYYEALVPTSDKGKDFSNTVVVIDNNVNVGSYNYSQSLDILPCTALVSDRVDRILMGLLILITAIFMYKNNWHIKIGQKFWIYGGKNLSLSIREIVLSVTDKEKNNLERRLLEKNRRN